MAIYPIRTFGDPVLRTKAANVADDPDSLQRLIDDMLETMYEAPGVGLAAPQIGISKRLFVADVGENGFKRLKVPVNVADDRSQIRRPSEPEAAECDNRRVFIRTDLGLPSEPGSV